MPIFTGQELVDRACAQSDMHDNFVTPQQWLAWLNVERRGLTHLLARNGWQFNNMDFTSFTLDGTSQPVLNLGVEFQAIVGVWETRTDGTYRKLEYKPAVDYPSVVNNIPSGDSLYYTLNILDLGDSEIRLFPPPQGGGTFLVAFLPEILSTTALASQIGSYQMGVEEWIVLRLARRALIKEESDTSSVDRLIRECEQQIEELCWGRVVGEVPAVRNVDADRRQWIQGLTYSHPQSWAWV